VRMATLVTMSTAPATFAVGNAAPDFSLVDQHGEPVVLSELQGTPVMIYFYPKADTPGCTTQACGLRDVIAEGSTGSTVVIGISPDPVAKLARFDTKYTLGFTLASDPDHEVAAAYGAWGPKKLYGREYEGIIRSAVLIGADGVVSHHWPKISPKDTPTKLLAALGA
jgi:thioredoxin-dependent peroxiredoxin